MKRVLTIIIVMLMLLGVTAKAQNFSFGILNSKEAIPEGLKADSEDVVSRGAFASVAAAVAGMEKREAVDTVFSDVSKDFEHSGAIQAVYEGGFMSGIGDGKFGLDLPITGNQAVAVFVRILGYDIVAQHYGGWPDGYTRVAQSLGLFKAFSGLATEPLKKSDLWKLCDLVMETPVGTTDYISGEEEVKEQFYVYDDAPLYMNKHLGIYRYEAVIDSVDIENYSCVISVTKNEDGAPYAKGEKVSLSVSSAVNILQFDKMAAEIFVDENETVLSVLPAKQASAKYVVVSSVNGDDRVGVKYLPSAIYNLMFLDDRREYKMAPEGLKVYYNGKLCNQSISLTGKYVRAVFTADKVSALEVWEILEGGLITELNYNCITFIKGENKQRLNELDSYKKRMVVINGEIREFSELKTGTIFDYYIDRESGILVIFASEKKISDTFESVGEDTIEVGNLSLLREDIVFASKDGVKYDSNTLYELMRKKVVAYVDSKERVRYVVSADVTDEDNEFIGYFLGVEMGKLSSSPKLFKIVNLEESDFNEAIYNVSEKFSFDGNVNDMYVTAGAMDGSAIFKFELNDKGEISSAKKAEAFYGFADSNGEAKVQYIGSFPQSSFPYMWVGGKKLYFETDVNIVGMYEKDGEIVFKRSTWDSLSGKMCDDSVVARFFGEDMSSDVDLIFMTGDLGTITPMENDYGVVTKIISQRMENGEYGKKITINNEKSYVLSNEKAIGIEKNSFINYGSGALFGDSEICILSSVALHGDMFEWVGAGNDSITIKTGTIEKIDEKRVYFTDGTAHFINRAQPLFFSVEDDGSLENGSYMDGLEGKEIVYAADNSLIYAVFYKK